MSNDKVQISNEIQSSNTKHFLILKFDIDLAGTRPVPLGRDRRGQGAQYKRNVLSGKPRAVRGELHILT